MLELRLNDVLAENGQLKEASSSSAWIIIAHAVQEVKVYQRQVDLLRQQSTAVQASPSPKATPAPAASGDRSSRPESATVAHIIEENERLKREAERSQGTLKSVKSINEKLEQEVGRAAARTLL